MIKGTKRIFAMIIAVAVMFTCVGMQISAADSQYFKSNSPTVAAGQTTQDINLEITMNNVDFIKGYQMDVNYNPAVFKVQQVLWPAVGILDVKVANTYEGKGGIVEVAATNTYAYDPNKPDTFWDQTGDEPKMPATFVIVTIRFRLLDGAAAGVYPVTLSDFKAIGQTEDIPLASPQMGSITVIGSSGSTGSQGNEGDPTPAPTPTQAPVVTNPAPTATPQTPSSKPSPVDIVEVSWAQEYIQDVIDKGIMKGYVEANGETSFKPKGTATRAEFATALFNYLGFQKDGTKTFSDTQDHWAKDYIAKMVKEGIMTGYSDAQFAPGDPVTREQIATILNRAFKPQNTPLSFQYTDNAVISTWANDSVYAVRWAGWMSGDVSGAFRPKDTATRAEIATIFSRLAKQGVAR